MSTIASELGHQSLDYGKVCLVWYDASPYVVRRPPRLSGQMNVVHDMKMIAAMCMTRSLQHSRVSGKTAVAIYGQGSEV